VEYGVTVLFSQYKPLFRVRFPRRSNPKGFQLPCLTFSGRGGPSPRVAHHFLMELLLYLSFIAYCNKQLIFICILQQTSRQCFTSKIEMQKSVRPRLTVKKTLPKNKGKTCS